MAGGGSSTTNAPKPRKRVEAETKPETSNTNTLLRAKDGSAFARCEGCNKNVAVALISMHNCSLDAKIRVNLEAQVVETQTEAKKKPVAERKKSTTDEPKPKRLRKAKDGKKSSTSNKPKRPLTAFFIFMNDFRKTYQEENLSKNVKDVAKHGGEKWKSLTEEEKKVYLDKAAELKAEYNKSLENDANEEEEDVEKQSDADAEEKEVDEAEEKEVDEADENEVEKKEAGEAQVVETQTEAKKRPVVERKKSTTDEPKPKRLRKAKDGKKSSTSNKPKRPLTAFFIFMNDFRKTYKEECLFRKNLKDYPKHGAEKWKSLTEEEKKVYLDKAAELKAEYNKSLENNANEEEEDEEKQSDADAEEKEVDEAEENEVEKKEAGGKEEEEEEILDDY